MAYITLDRSKLQTNYQVLDQLMREQDKSWAVVSKMFCGHEPYLKELVDLGVDQICDSRISNLEKVKKMAPDVQTIYIKPPAKRSIPRIVRYADVSFNTELATIEMLSEEAKKQDKVHKVIIMIELGDLREGIMGKDLIEFYSQVFDMPNIEVSGIGSNLNCLNGVLPSEDKLIILSLYEQLIEARFDKGIPWVTGGTSVIIPMLMHRQVPKSVNHFRVGESLFFGNNLITNEPIPEMEQDLLKLHAEIIEITEKPKVPIGYLAENPSGEVFEVDEEDYGKKMERAIIDIGLLDINTDFLSPYDENIEFVGASSDMIVVDLDNTDESYKVGDLVSFKMSYMGALSLLNSDYVEKRVL
jgi:predicted amino acid racemase